MERSSPSAPQRTIPKTSYVDSYVTRLPWGLDSYPDVATRGALVKQFLFDAPSEELRAALPPELHYLLDPALPASGWVPDAHANAAFLSLRDVVRRTDASWLEYAAHRNTAYVRGPFFQTMQRILRPERLMKTMPIAWNYSHRNHPIEVEIDSRGPRKRARVELHSPPGLVPELVAGGYATALRTVLTLYEDRAIDVMMVEHSPTRTLLVASWG